MQPGRPKKNNSRLLDVKDTIDEMQQHIPAERSMHIPTEDKQISEGITIQNETSDEAIDQEETLIADTSTSINTEPAPMTDEVINIDSMPIEIDDNHNINNVIPTLRKSQRLADKKMSQAYAAKSKGNLNIRRASQIDATNTKSASQTEFETLLEKETFIPVHRKDLTQEQLSRNISGFTFLKKNLKVDGTLDKWKARFVAGGDRVDTEGLGPLHSYTGNFTPYFSCFL